MYQELEMWKEYQAEQKAEKTKIEHNHERVASVSAIAFFVIIGVLLVTFVN